MCEFYFYWIRACVQEPTHDKSLCEASSPVAADACKVCAIVSVGENRMNFMHSSISIWGWRLCQWPVHSKFFHIGAVDTARRRRRTARLAQRYLGCSPHPTGVGSLFCACAPVGGQKRCQGPANEGWVRTIHLRDAQDASDLRRPQSKHTKEKL